MANTSSGIAPEFLEKYKSLELTLRTVLGSDMSVLKYEDMLNDEAADKMRLCRVVRNFLQHTPKATTFMQPSQPMLDFLDKQIMLVLAQAEKAKDLMYRVPAIKKSMSLRDVAKLFAKGQHDWLPIVDEKNQVVGVLTEARAMKAIAGSGDLDNTTIGTLLSKSELSKSLATIPVVGALDSLEAYARLSQPVIVVRDGKYSGVIQW